MQAKLEVRRAARHPRISPPRLNLRRSASYQNDKGPLSATATGFSFSHLLFSPPPSPSLPALVPRPKKSPTRPRPSRVFRLVLWMAGTVLVLYAAARLVLQYLDGAAVRLSYIARETGESRLVSEDWLPDFPTPIMVKDPWGRSSWTVSIPRNYGFPWTVKEYSEMSSACQKMAATVRGSRKWSATEERPAETYTTSNPYYVDVHDAERKGLLPAMRGDQGVSKRMSDGVQGSLVGVPEDSTLPECERTMTVVLETSDAGLGNTMMMLWTFYGIAEEQGRSFFIDDTRWSYGQYTAAFKPPPAPKCRPPPRHEMVPCPTQARHLVVSAATARNTLLDSLSMREGGSLANDDGGRKVLFDLARRGYEALFHVVQEDVEYVDLRVKELSTQAVSSESASTNARVASIHIRRGDRHPLEFPYRDSYIPHEIYIESAHAALSKRYGSMSSGKTSPAPLLVVASDDPAIYKAQEFASAHHAQKRIKLAVKEPTKKTKPNKNYMHRFVDEAFGWEGGFFSAMFWNLGLPKGTLGSYETEASPDTVRLRSYLGRAYLMDLAVLARTGDVVVCAVSSMGCRMLAVMMGWEEAIEKGKWVNIDGEHEWMGLTW